MRDQRCPMMYKKLKMGCGLGCTFFISIIFLFFLLHVYLYSIGRYHHEVLWEDYEVARKVDEAGLYGKWIIKRPTYDAAYAKWPNSEMEGWEDSELVLRPDHTFTFRPILLYFHSVPEAPLPWPTTDKMSEENVQIFARNSMRRLHDFRMRNNIVLHGDWKYYRFSGSVYLYIDEPEKHGIFEEIIIIGRIYSSGKKPGDIDQYVIGRTMEIRDYTSPKRCYYHRISKE